MLRAIHSTYKLSGFKCSAVTAKANNRCELGLPQRWFRSPPNHEAAIANQARPMQGRDAARTGHIPNQTAPTANPVVRWQATIPDDHETWSWLIGSANTIYAATNNTIHVFDASTGERDWRTNRFTTPPWTDHRGTLETSPALNGKRLLLGASTSLYALNRTDGDTRWAYKTNSSLDATLHAGNTVYASSLVGSDDRLVAVDARSGIERWRTPPSSGVHPHAYSAGYVVGPLIGRKRTSSGVE